MALTPGTHVGPYEIAEPIGVGGMGEVYRATDTNLKRLVAIKVLPASVASDAERLARFQREAEVLATLNHPHIAGIYGLERADGVTALVMELVEGATLAERIERGPIPLDEALPIALQIAEALEAAHEQNIVHRDLKPANIKIRSDGAVKVLDFGLAKAMDPASALRASAGQAADGAPHLSMSPTITTPAMTQAGMILGTAAYMSPEQAKGRPVDRRTDVWAFGCILYEMLTGRRAFDGEDVTDTIAAVVRGEPDWSALPSEASPQIRLLLKRCLEKDRRVRVADVSVARFLMTETIEASIATGLSASPPTARTSRRGLGIAAALGLIGGAIFVAGAAWAVGVFRSAPPARPVRFVLVPSAGHPLSITGTDHDVAMSPDGSYIVYRSSSGLTPTQAYLVVRDLNDLENRPLASTAGARNPFFSPDGRWVGFFAGGELQKISIAGGPAVTICKVEGGPRGASWGDDDNIVFATVQGGVERVPAAGGDPKPLMSRDLAMGETHLFPIVLPGSQVVLFTVRSGTITASITAESVRIDVLELRTGQRRTILRGGQDAAYTDSGHLVYAVAPATNTAGRPSGSLRAVRFDLKRLAVTSDPVPVVGQLAVFLGTGAADFALSRHGDLVYVPDDPRVLLQSRPRSLVWVSRRGMEEPIAAPERSYAVARISPDGTRVALDVRDQTNDIWIWDLTRKTLTPLNRDPALDMSPLWTPDGHRIIWTSTRGGGNPNLHWQASDGTGSIERLTTNAENQFPTSIAPDGSHVVIFGGGPSRVNLFTVALQRPDRKAEPLIQAPFTYFGGEISPDGHWLTYHSNESGEYQVYVRPYPRVDSGRFPISATGGSRPAWAHSGRELFYLDGSGLLTSVAVQAKEGAFAVGTPAKILTTTYYGGATSLGLDLRAFDVAPDDQRFLMIKDVGPSPQQVETPSPSMIVVSNWVEELKARLPPK